MLITNYIFDAYLRCPTKCWLLYHGESGSGNTYTDWVVRWTEAYRSNAIKHLLDGFPESAVTFASTEPLRENIGNWQIAVNLPASWCNLKSHIHVVEKVRDGTQSNIAQFVPIRLVPFNKINKQDRLGLAFDALVLSKMLATEIGFGKIIHGDDRITLKVNISPLIRDLQKAIEKIAALLSSPSPPDLLLNPHCPECEFQGKCRQEAVEKDNLSLLPGMTEKQRKKLNGKGIFAIVPLSYTFRARRRPKRLVGKSEKYQHSLKALAIRERKIHIVGSPQLKTEGTLVYVDVESVPDRDFYYLIGVRIPTSNAVVQHSLWADNADEERNIWTDLLSILSSVEKPVLVHYGSFETTFLRRMCQRYGGPREDSELAAAIKSSINLLTVTYAKIYFPTLTNSLKDIATSLGFEWSDPSLFGLNSIVCRSDWEISRCSSVKQRLLTYNIEDCKALELVTQSVEALCQGPPAEKHKQVDGVVYADQLKPIQQHFLINQGGAALPEFVAINQAAYWDYQRHRVYVRSSRIIKNACKKNPDRGEKTLPVRRIVRYADPSSCPSCGNSHLVKKTQTDMNVYEVHFTQSGVKGWVTRHIRGNWYCIECNLLVRAPGDECASIRKYGQNLRAYAVYQMIQLRISQSKVAESLGQLFGFNLHGDHISLFKSDFADYYANTFREIRDRIVVGGLIHADETKAEMNRAVVDSPIDADETKKTVSKSGYVWVLSSLEDVVYLYSDTREGEMIHELLKNFCGVLVSDFYPVYDAVDCAQQKCLIHLMRDLNDDLHKYAYDEDLRKVAQEFANTLRPMVETIDKHGLKTYYMAKHLPAVEKFFAWLSAANFVSEAAEGYQKRFRKNRDKLFTFLTHDGVPWNNNNAENAVRSFAELRTVIRGTCSEKGLREYLVLLSICETCKRRGLSFLDFMLSGERSIDKFAKARRSHNKRRRKQPKTGQMDVSLGTCGGEFGRLAPKSSADPPTSVDSQDHDDDHELPSDELAAWSRATRAAIDECTARFDARQRLERFDHVPAGSSLIALPALRESGLWANTDKIFHSSVDKAFQEMVLLITALFCLTRLPFVEALHFFAPRQWKTLFYGERLGNNRLLAEAIRIIGRNQSNVVSWKLDLAARWLGEAPKSKDMGDIPLEFDALHFIKYQKDNVALERLLWGVADRMISAHESTHMFSGEANFRNARSKCNLAEKEQSEMCLTVPNNEVWHHINEDEASHFGAGVGDFISVIKLITFRAEHILTKIVDEQESRIEETNLVLRDLFTSPADLVPNWPRGTLTVRLHSNHGETHTEMLQHLCFKLNATETIFPGTDLRLRYELSFSASD